MSYWQEACTGEMGIQDKPETKGLERLKSRIVTKGYLQVPGVDYMERFSPVATDTSTRMIIDFTLYYDWLGYNWICEAFDVEAAFLESYMDTLMFIEWPEGMVELGFLTKEQYKSTCVELCRSM